MSAALSLDTPPAAPAEPVLSAPLHTTLLVVRHAEVHNPRDIVYGRLPRFGLSVRGREQAERTARFLAARPVSVIVTSPLLRARQTAQILAAYHPQAALRRSAALLEVRTGYQGSPNTILKPGFSFYDPLKEPGDETMTDVFARMLQLLRRLVRQHVGQTVVTVSHGDPIAILRVGLEGRALTPQALHSTVYPARSSVNQIVLQPGAPPALAYFNVAEVDEVQL